MGEITRHPKGEWGMYQAAEICVMHWQGIYKRCKASTRQPKRVQGIDKASTRGARHLPGSQKGVQGMGKASTRGVRHVQSIYKGCEASTRQLKGVWDICTRQLKGVQGLRLPIKASGVRYLNLSPNGNFPSTIWLSRSPSPYSKC